ncbi:MAG: hypothetical protein JNK45_06105 [Myxococcales bacterium]|nr:hypothetical protein [Myxococcales bacterium]
MGIARFYDRTVHRELACRAAWPPIANNFALGDYGLIAHGVFFSLGNIERDFGVPVDASADSPAGKLDFVSESATIARLAAGGQVAVFPDQPIDAQLVFDFESAESLVLKSSAVVTREMRNAEVAAKALRSKKGWRLRYRVVRQIVHASHALVITTREASTKVTFAAHANLLRQLELGNVGVDIDVGSDKSVGLELVGKAGIIGLGLFRVRLLGGGAAPVDIDGGIDRDDDDAEELDDDV